MNTTFKFKNWSIIWLLFMSVYSGWCVWLLLITFWGIIKLDIVFVLLSSILENWKIILHVLYVVETFAKQNVCGNFFKKWSSSHRLRNNICFTEFLNQKRSFDWHLSSTYYSELLQQSNVIDTVEAQVSLNTLMCQYYSLNYFKRSPCFK